MAVYKSTYCYPFLNSMDVRVAKTSAYSTYPVQYLKCKVDTSNKKITGYKIRLLDSDNTQIFPTSSSVGYISPLKELRQGNMLDVYYANGTNSGINGTYLQLPFFQTYNDKKLDSYNAIYYKGMFMTDHIILGEKLGAQAGYSTLTYANNLANWNIDTTSIPGEACLAYNWPDGSEAYFVNDATSKILDTDTLKYINKDTSEETDMYEMYYVSNNSTDTMTLVRTAVGADGIVYVIEDDNEEWIEKVYALDKYKNRITLDGEIVLTGQTVFVGAASDDTSDNKAKVGFYVVTKIITKDSSGISVITTLLRPLTAWNDITKATTTPLITTIKNGTNFHNTNWSTVNKISTYCDVTTTMWCDCKGNDISNLNLEGNTYKWEITLYQGECSTKNTPMIADYSNITVDTYDMTIGTGTVCGSCLERIQIASDDAFTSNGDLNTEAILPGLTSETLVLQTRYIDLKETSGGIFSGIRNYVKTYSEGYGYVYPDTTNLNATIITNSNYAQFFKHSNQESDILDTDIVDWGVNTAINIHFFDNVDFVDHTADGETQWLKDVSVNNRLLVIADENNNLSNLPTALQNMTSGQKVLLINQGSSGNSEEYIGDYSKYNGVYKYYTLKGSNNVTYNCIERAASYTTWSSYIGKIIYVRNGNGVAGSNQQSLAQAGSYTLWDPLADSTPGDSALGFVAEMPILLFQNKLKAGRTYNFFSTSDVYPASGMLDGETLQADNIVLSKTGNVFKVDNTGNSSASSGAGSWSQLTDTTLIPDEGDYIYFTHGAQHAERVFKFQKGKSTQQTDANWDLYTAKVLKNSQNYTYISPSTLLKAGMKLKLTHGHTVLTYQNITTNWLDVNSVNSTLYCVKHQKLSNPVSLSAETSAESGTPWKYEIRSYFKTSDENPFYINEDPYLILYKNNLPYSDLAMLKDTSSGTMKYCDASVVTGRSVKLAAKYIQYQGASWESFRWILKDNDGNILQDTGVQYTKDLSVIFYGLTNDETSGAAIYYALLYVEDDLGNTLQYSVKLSVSQSDTLTLPIPLTANFDCDMQAVKLKYQDNGILAPSYRVLSIGDEGVDYEYCVNLSTYWDGGIKYDSNVAYITGPNYDQTAPIDYSAGSTISGDDGTIYTDNLSLAERYGANYYTYFNKSDLSHLAASDYSLNLTSQEDAETGDLSNELYFETQVTLMSNFCGQIVSWDVQGKDWEGISDPYVTTIGATNSKAGYVTFSLGVSDNFSNSTLNPLRNTFVFSIMGYDQTSNSNASGYGQTLSLTGLTLFPITDTLKTMYYLQLQDVVGSDETYRNENYEYLHVNLTHPLYLCYDTTNNNYYTGGEYALGNLCLVKNDGTSKYFTYWVEDRPLLNNPAIESFLLSTSSHNNTVQEVQNVDRTYGSTDGKLIWGSDGLPDYTAATSEQWYWKEDSNTSLTTNPATWDEVDSTNEHVKILTVMNRHYSINDNAYHLLCKIKDVDGLYKALLDSSLIITEEAASSGDSTSILLGDNGLYGTIIIEQTKEE